MHNYHMAHLRNLSDAICTRVFTDEGKRGIVTNVKHVGEARIFTVMFDDGTTEDLDYWKFYVDVELIDGHKYMLMTGEIATIHVYPYGNGFFVNYSELTHDDSNSYEEHIDSNGFAYHYDCGMNVLKEII